MAKIVNWLNIYYKRHEKILFFLLIVCFLACENKENIKDSKHKELNKMRSLLLQKEIKSLTSILGDSINAANPGLLLIKISFL